MIHNTTIKPGIAVFLQIWQILELIGLLFAIPLVFFFGILLTGDSSKVFDFVNANIIPVMGIFLLLKIIVTIFFFKAKRWTIYFNLFQNLLLALIQLGLVVATFVGIAANPDISSSSYFSTFPFLISVGFFVFLTWANRQCLRHPFYKRSKN